MAVFYLFVCACIVPACSVFGCIMNVHELVINDECNKHARREDKDGEYYNILTALIGSCNSEFSFVLLTSSTINKTGNVRIT